MKAIIIGCGRVGAAIAKAVADQGWKVVSIDEDEQAFARLGDEWRGRIVVGHGMDAEVLEEAGIEHADAVVVATNGDNTNIVVAQVARERYGVRSVAVRILDPARAEFYSGRGFAVISPTAGAIEFLREWAAGVTPPAEKEGVCS